MNPQFVIIADDLSGAADASAGWADAGLVTMVALTLDREVNADGLAVSTESRDLCEKDAVRRVGRAAKTLGGRCGDFASTLLYKKIDSTLRGHPGAELGALMRAAGQPKVVIAPAFPAQGRTTLGGRQLVKGIPVDQSAGWEKVDSDLTRVFSGEGAEVVRVGIDDVREGSDRVADLLRSRNSGLFVVDAETDSDLEVAAAAGLRSGIRLFCGSAGLMSSFRRVAPWKNRVPIPELPLPVEGPTLVLAGSRHPATVEQVAMVASHGVSCLRIGELSPSRGRDDAAEAAIACLDSGEDVVLMPPGDPGGAIEPIRARAVAARLANSGARVFSRSRAGRLVATGGDTASAVFDRLGATAFWVRGEVLPGVPHGRLVGGCADGLPVVTKAGGFGSRAALVEILRLDKKAGG